MRREWKPGAVALLQYRNYPPAVALFDGGAQRWTDADGATFDGDEDDLTITPLVALRLPNGALAGWPVLMNALRTAGDKTGLHMIFEGLIGQIEEQVGSPKPEEPTGLGAVVEDAKGERYVRHAIADGSRWCDSIGIARSWERVAAVRVLSPGVEDGAS